MNEEIIPMDCAQFERIVSDLHRPGILEQAVRKAASGHASACSQCAALLAESEALDLQLLALAADTVSVAAPERLEQHLRRAFRNARGDAGRRRIPRHAAALGAAAAIVLALGLWLYRRPQPGAGRPSPGGGAARIPVSPAPLDVRGPQPRLAAMTPPRRTSSNSKPVAARARRASGSSSSAGTDAGEAFIPLPDSDVSAALEDGAVVQVTMPREALASFGFPVAAMEGGGAVRADLLVSADGMPQAIHLLSQDDSSRPRSTNAAGNFSGRKP